MAKNKQNNYSGGKRTNASPVNTAGTNAATSSTGNDVANRMTSPQGKADSYTDAKKNSPGKNRGAQG
jgi:hypothetical protein